MRVLKPLLICLAVLTFGLLILSLTGSAQNQNPNPTGNPVKIIGLGFQNYLPTSSEGTPYLPVRNESRQATFTAEQWQATGVDVRPLLLNGNSMPKQVTICGHGLSMIQMGLVNSADDGVYFPMTVNGTRVVVPDDGCYSITPAAYLRIKGILKISRDQLTTAVVTASY